VQVDESGWNRVINLSPQAGLEVFCLSQATGGTPGRDYPDKRIDPEDEHVEDRFLFLLSSHTGCFLTAG
jgi:hypothetical protein